MKNNLKQEKGITLIALVIKEKLVKICLTMLKIARIKQ